MIQKTRGKDENEIMRKKNLLAFLYVGCFMLAGCSMEKVDSAKQTVEEVVHDVKESVEVYKMHKDVEVHTEEEMRAFALECLEEKYGKPFLIDETYCEYEHLNGHEDKPMALYARAYPEDDEKDVCGLLVEEPNIFKDNYSVNYYLPKIEEKIFPEMEKYGVKGQIEIEYPLMTGTIGENLSAEDVIYDGNTKIYFYQEVADQSDISAYIPLIRKWMNFLYTCDFKWYFTLTAEGNINYQYIGISKSDYGYTSSDEWSDERIIEEIESCMRMSE